MKKGFTLIELLVVVLIIGILAAVALPQYQRAVSKSRYTQVMILANAAANAAVVYKLANGVYPPTFDVLDITLPGTLSANKKSILLNGYSCRLFMGEAAMDSVLCTRGETAERNYLGYRVGLSEGTHDQKRYCVAQTGNNEALAFCASLSNQVPFDSGQGLMHYSL